MLVRESKGERFFHEDIVSSASLPETPGAELFPNVTLVIYLNQIQNITRTLKEKTGLARGTSIG
jgi:hypothetical protein